jgi:hypothetical protein
VVTPPAAVPPAPGAGAGGAAEDGVPAAGAVAGLAREVDGLRRAVDELRDLPERVDDLTRLITDLANAVAALTTRRTAAPCPSWLLLPADPAVAAHLLDELTGWLTAVYLRYPDAADHLPECWCWHPDVVEELLWLMHAWAGAYQGPQASVGLVGDWHDRQRPGVVRRIKTTAGSCSIENHQTRPGWTRRPSVAPAVPGAEGLDTIARWWGTRRDQDAPEPPRRLSSVGAAPDNRAPDPRAHDGRDHR